ncbi:hypothetical protein GCM10019016_041320 [Streptomyces prasinosporus]|uniref:LytR family transcriptional regulator n=1 Tax=Streptomyces prasinosporus TaxID=68256 RepID=A0ABP6TP01_9ACTN
MNAMAGDGSGAPHNHFADYDELPEGHFYDPDAEYEPDPGVRGHARARRGTPAP